MEVGTKFVRKQLVHSLNCQETSSDSRRLRSRICSWLFHWTHLCWLVCELECLSLVVPNVARFAYQMSTCMSWVFLDQGGGQGSPKYWRRAQKSVHLATSVENSLPKTHLMLRDGNETRQQKTNELETAPHWLFTKRWYNKQAWKTR